MQSRRPRANRPADQQRPTYEDFGQQQMKNDKEATSDFECGTKSRFRN